MDLIVEEIPSGVRDRTESSNIIDHEDDTSPVSSTTTTEGTDWTHHSTGNSDVTKLVEPLNNQHLPKFGRW